MENQHRKNLEELTFAKIIWFYLKPLLIGWFSIVIFIRLLLLSSGETKDTWPEVSLPMMCWGLFIILACYLHLYLSRLESIGNSDEVLRLRHSRTVELQGKTDEVIQRCERALSKINTVTRTIQKSPRSVSAKTFLTWKSHGEQIALRCTPNPNDKVEVLITSQPIQKPLLLDYGKNLQNVVRIESYLRNWS